MTLQELLSNNPKILEKYPDAINITSTPISNFKHANHWVTNSFSYDSSLQDKIDEIFDEVYELYPDRIIVGFAKQYQTLANSSKNLRKKINNIETKTFFKGFGFYYDLGQIAGTLTKFMPKEETTATNDNNQDVKNNDVELIDINKIFYDGSWHSLSGRIYNSQVQQKINNVMNKVLEYYPNRVIISLSSEHEKFAQGTVVKTRRLAGYPDGTDGNIAFFGDYGFVFYLKKKEIMENAKERRKEELKAKNYKAGIKEETLLKANVDLAFRKYDKNNKREARIFAEVSAKNAKVQKKALLYEKLGAPKIDDMLYIMRCKRNYVKSKTNYYFVTSHHEIGTKFSYENGIMHILEIKCLTLENLNLSAEYLLEPEMINSYFNVSENTPQIIAYGDPNIAIKEHDELIKIMKNAGIIETKLPKEANGYIIPSSLPPVKKTSMIDAIYIMNSIKRDNYKEYVDINKSATINLYRNKNKIYDDTFALFSMISGDYYDVKMDTVLNNMILLEYATNHDIKDFDGKNILDFIDDKSLIPYKYKCNKEDAK